MRPTEAELAAARVLGEALAHYLVAREDGAARRRADRPAEESTAHVDQTAPPQPEPASPSVPSRARVRGRLLLTAGEASDLLAVSDVKLRELTAPRGPIPAVRFGRTVRYRVDDLANAVAHMTTSRQ